MTAEDHIFSPVNELVLSEEAFFFERSLDLLSVVGLDGYFRRINPAFTQILGYSEAEFLARPFLDFVHPDDHIATLAEMEKIKAGIPIFNFENRYRTKDGDDRWLEWTASPQISRGVIYCVARDITQQKQTEVTLQNINQELEQRIAERTAELEQANAALRESEERNQLAMEVARIYTFEWDVSTDAVKRSPQCGVILGLTPSSAQQDTGTNFFQRVHPDDRDRFKGIIQTLKPENSSYKITYRLLRPDEQIITFEESGRGFFDQQGKLIRLIGMVADITERQRLAAELESSRATLQQQLTEIETIYQSAPIGLNVLDPDLRFVRINQQLAEINGFSVEEHLGRTIRELLPDIADTAEQLIRPIFDTGEPLLNVEIRGETPAQPGVERVWLEKFLPLKDGERVIGVSTVCEEITERKRTEEQLRQFNLLIELSYEPILVWSFEQGIISWNQGCEQLYGYTREQVMGQNTHILLQTVYPLPLAELLTILERDRQWTGELKHTTHTGQQVIVESRQQLIETNGQKLVLETNRDITEHKKSELALRRSEERYRTLFKTMEDGFCVIEMLFDENNKPVDYCFLEINPAFERETGLRQAVGKTARQLLPNLEEFWFETYGRVALTGEPVRFENGSEVMNRWFEVYAFPIERAENRKVAILFKNISYRKAIETQREKLLQQEQAAREAAERANQIKDEFLAILSHELRTPLNPILGWAKMLQSPKMNAEKLQHGLITIERNAKQQAQLIDDLLDISRIIRGKLSLSFGAVNLSEPIAAALETVNLAAQAKAIKLDVLLEPLKAYVRGDAGRLQQVIWNLLSNAIKFTPHGGQVTVQLTCINNHAHIQVSDTGKGIQAEFLPFVFELFQQQDSSTTRNFGGLGLGLAIARKIIEAHGGSINAASAGEGQGATFTVQLPLMSALNLHTPDDSDSQKLSIENLRVVVVDDEADSLELLKVILEQEGALVKEVLSPIKALPLLATTPFDLLISDIGMPDMDGYTFIHQVRHLVPQFNRDIPAIALTAFVGETNKRQILAAGFQAHLAKPIEPQLLLDAIATLIT
ncbi:PAS domain S-box protein [Nostoc sp. FACHB-87]|uniref:PAS domain S-box protein n=1 Tax=Nostocaceae TaxID=1162 RepID=UPI0016824E5D|nr:MULTISPECIES: PAS domain S-box protein [Nostocaceae]MBD2453969.1 PAS domain S-box protein [Nostoc sp. FACHB-87]MBD2476094.1 PAS domain S-box protein [Anabaena sp. FACHB-83]